MMVGPGMWPNGPVSPDRGLKAAKLEAPPLPNYYEQTKLQHSDLFIGKTP